MSIDKSKSANSRTDDLQLALFRLHVMQLSYHPISSPL